MRSSQYMVSFVSLSAISNFDIKSFLLCANCASATLAPTEVPARNNWFIIDEEALRSCNTLAQAIILSLNASDFSLSIFEDISASITHSAQQIIIRRSRSSFGAADHHSAPADHHSAQPIIIRRSRSSFGAADHHSAQPIIIRRQPIIIHAKRDYHLICSADQ
jgi:hypothetical protein